MRLPRVTRSRPDSALVISVVAFAPIIAAERAQAYEVLTPQGRSIQSPDAARAEALPRKVYEEGTRPSATTGWGRRKGRSVKSWLWAPKMTEPTRILELSRCGADNGR